MAAHEERLAVVETMVNEHSLTLVELRDSMLHLEQRMDARFDRVDARFDRVDARFDRMDDKFAHLEGKVSRLFTWIVGIQITVLLAVIGSLLSVVAILAPR